MRNKKRVLLGLPCVVPCAALGLLLTACGGQVGEKINPKPAYLGQVTSTVYDGTTDDLLTAGLGRTGLASGSAPTVLDAQAPSGPELRRLAIYSNYRALVDTSGDGGFGRLYGPNIDINGGDTLGEGKIGGTEYIAYTDSGDGSQNVTLMVQVPANFDSANPCIITGTSSGSRGVYGAIATSGEWGLKHRCAVAYSDKGTGNGIHDLQANTVSLQNGVRAPLATAGTNANFAAKISEAERTAFIAANPKRVAVKHAHSQQNPEKDWGKWTLQSIEFALYLLNEQFADLAKDGKGHLIRYTASNTLVIASSVSNGGGAALAAAEQDVNNLIDGVAVSEPAQQLLPEPRLMVTRTSPNGNVTLTGSGRSLYDYISMANLLQPCAALAQAAGSAPFLASLDPTTAQARCRALQRAGLITGSTVPQQADSAQAALLAFGFQPESRDLHAAMYATATPAIATTYSNALGRFSVLDNLCGLSFFNAGSSIPVSFATGNGVPPTAEVVIYNNFSVGGPLADALSITPSTGVRDYNIDGAQCQRELATGSSANAKRVQSGITEASRTGNLRGKPALIVHGRADTLIPVSFTSRPYFGVNRIVEGTSSRLSYIEVTNGQHFDSFLTQPGFAANYIPLHVYFNRALDLVYANLKGGAALPPSQVVRTRVRGVDAGGKANPITAANVPPIAGNPVQGDQINFANNVVTVPE
jgi:hydroxybutyrate-dimer hydrolase